jgi:hypothetical protein
MPVIVIDRYEELELVIKTSRELGIRPHLGVRARLTAKGAGKWIESTGDRSKFGLSASEIVDTVDRLRSEDMLDCMELLHFHIGSQITAIRAHKDALAEACRIFVGLHDLGARPRLLDVGGGLAVDYDGSRTNFHSSKNYSTQEYANDVVAAVQEACDEADVPNPDIVAEAGRSMVAHHSVLVFDVLGVNELRNGERPAPATEDDPKVVQDLAEVWQTITKKNVQEAYHDALQLKEEAATLFSLGYLDLRGRARVDRLFWACCATAAGSPASSGPTRCEMDCASADANSVPNSASPSTCPSSRENVAVAVTTPISRGSDAACMTSVYNGSVGPTPRPTSSMRRLTAICVDSGVSVNPSSANEPASSASAKSIIAFAWPNRDTACPAAMLEITMPSVSGIIARPASVADTPTTFTRNSGRKMMPNRNAAPMTNIAAVPYDTTRLRNSSKCRMGSGARRSRLTKPTRPTAATASIARICHDAQA